MADLPRAGNSASRRPRARWRKKDGPRSDVKQFARQTDGYSGGDLEGIVKDAIEDAFLEAEPEPDTGHLHRSMEKSNLTP